ncbi:hypothetical protein HQ587_00510 [bacterium]|nr:hypothetical protein [bacterium]
MPDKSEEIRFNQAGWQVSVHENGFQPVGPDWVNEFSEMLIRLENPDTVLKHDHRGEVGTFDIGEIKYVIKKFTLQETRLWFRLASVFFPTLGEIACRNGLEMASDGIKTPRPVLLMQQTHNRMIVSSWLVYRFIEGRSMTEQDGEDIVRFVKGMHKSGWLHRDPHPGNFILTPEGVATIDPIRARQSRNRYLRAYDVALMAHDMPDVLEIYGREELGFWFSAAKFGHSLVRTYRHLKHGLRRMLGIRNSGR